ncbi:ABC transporter permease [Spiroplasma endosymbiont of Dilophus febrilis]|uniref:ABC transporter permease n=1 Tax=Spiroplasma endosymbiont of Dilophus febrilis TaxID=3066292 RepID=UPI00313DCF54
MLYGTNDIDNNQDWRQCVENVIASEMPSFVKKYLNNAKTKNRFAIGFNTLPYNPLEDELLTHYNSKINNENIKTHGIKPNNKMVKISDELQNKLKTIKTINNKIIIPIIINKSLQIKHHLNVGNIIDFTNTTRSLQYTTNENKWNKIPNNWWGYNSKNQEFINGKWQPQPNTENIWKMPNDKFTSASDKVTYGWTNRYGYQGTNENDKDIAQQYSNAKTYRNLNDVILRLPKNDIKDNNGNIIYQGISATTNNYFETLEAKQLPTGHQDKFIIATDETNNKWWVIRPYSIFWNNKTKQYINNSDFSSALNLITNGKNLFTLLSSAYWQSKPEEMKIGIDHFANESNVDGPYQYEVVGIHNSYNDSIIFMAQDYANDIIGVPNTKSSDIYQKDPFNNIALWSNGRYSSNRELIDITTRYSTFSTNGLYNSADGWAYTNAVDNYDLLSTKQELIKKIATVAASMIAIFITNAIIIAVIIITMITSLSLDQFSKMMAILQIQGYKYRTINNLILTMFLPSVLIGFIGGVLLAWTTASIFIYILQNFFLLIIPFSLVWWVILISFVIIIVIYSSTYIMTTYHLKKLNVLELVKNSDE